jgi:superfamily I DNA and RNA helicase
MKDLRQFIKTTIREFLNEHVKQVPPDEPKKHITHNGWV